MATGTNIQLVFNPSTNGYSTADHGRECDFDKEHGKVSRTALSFISIHTAMRQHPVATPHSQLFHLRYILSAHKILQASVLALKRDRFEVSVVL